MSSVFTVDFTGFTARNAFGPVACGGDAAVTIAGMTAANDCTWSQGVSGARLTFVLVIPGGPSLLNAASRLVLSDALVTNPSTPGSYDISVSMDGSPAGTATTSVTIGAARWSASWAAWMNSGIGGWVCNREEYWTGSG
ncbi:MAG: hypothetical protein IPO93_14160 [Actinobacteria bacterium]|nr:hypothetical protein [Actinomycetota bacterium]